MNCAHGGAANARQDVAALQEVFPFVASIQDPKVGRSGRRGNVVAVACNEGVVPARITRPRELERWVAGCPALTDEQVGYPPAH